MDWYKVLKDRKFGATVIQTIEVISSDGLNVIVSRGDGTTVTLPICTPRLAYFKDRNDAYKHAIGFLSEEIAESERLLDREAMRLEGLRASRDTLVERKEP